MTSLFAAVDWAHWPSRINPVLAQIGPFSLQWYSVMYVCAIVTTYALILRRLRREKDLFPVEAFEAVFPWVIFGVVAGARIGYVLAYDFSYYAARPWEIVLPFHWGTGGFVFTGIRGLSYHGGLIGGILAGILSCRHRGVSPRRFGDVFALALPFGYAFGRVGNFLNGELWGRATSVPWGMYFPEDPSGLLRHPSQLYEAVGEGLLLGVVMRLAYRRFRQPGAILSLYVAGYGAVRFALEYFRQPDVQVGFVLGPLTMGQLLCVLMVLIGGGSFFQSCRKFE